MRVNGDEGTPVPIPNTVVKLINGENTWLVTAREDNTARTQSRFERICFFLVYKLPNNIFYEIKRASRSEWLFLWCYDLFSIFSQKRRQTGSSGLRILIRGIVQCPNTLVFDAICFARITKYAQSLQVDMDTDSFDFKLGF